MTRGQDQINSALAHIAGAAGQASLEADARQRLDSVSGDLQSLVEVIFVKSALCVPFTAACDRGGQSRCRRRRRRGYRSGGRQA